MKTRNGFFILMFLLLSSYAWALYNTNTGDIAISVQGLKHDNGQIIITLHSPFEGKFPSDEAIIKSEKAFIKNGTAIVEFRGIEYGNYAFAVHHDENGNGEMDTNFLGIPKEGWAFSNNSK